MVDVIIIYVSLDNHLICVIKSRSFGTFEDVICDVIGDAVGERVGVSGLSTCMSGWGGRGSHY